MTALNELLISPRPSLSAAIELLKQANLPTEDLTAAHCESFFYAGPASRPTGLVGLEILGDVALLRSLVVDPARRGTGEGTALLRHAEKQARARGVRTLYLREFFTVYFATGIQWHFIKQHKMLWQHIGW